MPERVVFEEEGRSGHIRIFATGEVGADLMDGVAGYIERQRSRANALNAGDVEVASWQFHDAIS
jgi:hypothetical protein